TASDPTGPDAGAGYRAWSWSVPCAGSVPRDVNWVRHPPSQARGERKGRPPQSGPPLGPFPPARPGRGPPQDREEITYDSWVRSRESVWNRLAGALGTTNTASPQVLGGFEAMSHPGQLRPVAFGMSGSAHGRSGWREEAPRAAFP